MYSKDFISKVMAANDLVDIVSEHSLLKQKSSDSLLGLCPYPDHNEKTPSFSLSVTKQVYHCFGCKKSGNIYSFLKDIRGFSFIDALEYLAGRASIPLEKIKNDNFKNTDTENKLKKKKQFINLNKKVLNYFDSNWKNLSSKSPVTKFLKDRNIKTETIKELSLVFSTSQWSGLIDYAVSNNLNLNQLNQLGLIQIKKSAQNKSVFNASDYYDTLRDRFIFPILSTQGELLAFGGRSFTDEMPKYINSPEHILFKKREVLYGLFFSAKYIRAKDYVIVVEGYMDFLSLYQAGIKNVVATLGTALTEGHARILKRYSKNIILLFDGDLAGQKATEKSLPILLKEALYVKTLSLENNLDPDDFIQKFGLKEFTKQISQAKDLFYNILNQSFQSYQGGAIDKLKVIDKIKPILDSVLDKRLKNLYIKELADRLQQNEGWLIKALQVSKKGFLKQTPQKQNNNTLEGANPKQAQEVKKCIYLDKIYPAELELINLALKEETYFLRLLKDKKRHFFISPEAIIFFNQLEQIYIQNSKKFDTLTGEIINSVFPKSAITRYMEQPMCDFKKQEEETLIQDCLYKLKNIAGKEESRLLSLKMKSENFSKDNLEQFMKIQKELKSPRKN